MPSPLISTNSSARPRTSSQTSLSVGIWLASHVSPRSCRWLSSLITAAFASVGSWWTTTTPSAVAWTSSSMPPAPASRASAKLARVFSRARRGMPRCAMRRGGRIGVVMAGETLRGCNCMLSVLDGRRELLLNDTPCCTSNLPDRMTDDAGDADDQTDLDLITRWKDGDQRAATLLVERHAGAVARFASSVGARGDVQDVVQDTFVRAFASLDSFRGDS